MDTAVGLNLTDQERVCYNLHTARGQMRWFIGRAAGFGLWLR
jgi:hypothetical protein